VAKGELSAWKVILYRDRHHKYPVREFLDALNKGTRVTVLRDIELLQQFGLAVGAPLVRPIAGVRKLWELRSKTTDGAIRIFYVAITGKRFVLLHAFIKKSQKTPASELDIARKRLGEVLAGENSQ
jgi:phage-related protein